VKLYQVIQGKIIKCSLVGILPQRIFTRQQMMEEAKVEQAFLILLRVLEQTMVPLGLL